jgi:hypothetical protein
MNGKSYKWLMKSLGSLSLASAVVMLPIILAGCSDDSSSSTVPLPPPPPPAPPPAPPAPPAPPPTPAPQNLLLSVVVTQTTSGGSGLGESTGLLPGGTVTGVSIGTSFRFRFGTSVNAAPFLSSFTIRASSGATVSTTCEFNFDSTEVVCTPNSPLVNDQTYTLTVSNVPDLFVDGRPLFPSPQTFTFTTGATAVGPGPISFLATQLAAVTPNGQIFSNPVVIPVGYGIRRPTPAENVPVGVYTDYRAVLSFPIPGSIPGNAVVSTAQLTLVQLPSNDSVLIGAGDFGRGFFFLDPTPSNVPANNVVFQEVTLGANNNVISSDFFAPASTPSFIALSINGNVLGGDVSAGPRTADVAPGVQRAISSASPRFYQVRLQCAKEVWNNQAFPVWVGAATAGGTISVTATIAQTAVATASQVIVNTVTDVQTLSGTGTISGNVPFTFSSSEGTQTVSFGGVTISGTFAINGLTVSATASVPEGTATIESQSEAGTFGFNATVTASASGSVSQLVTSTGTASISVTVPGIGTVTAIGTISVPATVTSTVVNAGLEVSQGADGVCRAEFDKDPGTGTAPITTARGPRLDVTFTVPR